MRLIVLVILLLFIAAGIVLGALNADLVGYDLGFASFSMPKGAALLGALVVGWLLGGLTAWLGVSHRHRRASKQANRNAETRQSVDA